MTDKSAASTHISERKSLLKAALILQRLGSHVRAIEGLSKLLTIEPSNITALRAIARSWDATGDHNQALMALERARLAHPDDVSICVEIADSYTRINDHEAAIRYIKDALAIDPNSAAANHAMAQTLKQLDRRGDALEHRQRVAVVPIGRNVTTFGTLDEPTRVLVITSSESSQPTIARGLRRLDLAMLIVEIETMSINVHLPEHDILLCTLSFDPRYRVTLQHLEEMLAMKVQPVINRPVSVLATDPAILAWRLAPIDGLRIAPVIRIPRGALLNADCRAELAARNIGFPLLIRASDMRHARREHIASVDDLLGFTAREPAAFFDCSPFYDLRSRDGRIRCYRVAMVGSGVYPLAFATAFHWRVNLTSGDAPADATKDEEDQFFSDTFEAIGASTIDTLKEVARCIEIDSCVMDFSLNDDGVLTLLRVDASSDWPDPGDGAAFGTRRRASDRARSAIFHLVTSRAEGLTR